MNSIIYPSFPMISDTYTVSKVSAIEPLRGFEAVLLDSVCLLNICQTSSFQINL